MPNDSEYVCPIQAVPTEILFNIFMYLPAKELMKCRQVCARWKLIIDGLARHAFTWVEFCKRDFEQFYWVARKKVSSDFSYYNLYRSLSLWPSLAYAHQEQDEFASASNNFEEIHSVKVLGNGRISVHKKGGIHYYHADSLKPSCHSSITGNYAKYTENDRVIVIQSLHLHLFVVRKYIHNVHEDHNATFDHVKLFLLTDTEIYFVTLNDDIFVVNICKEPIAGVFIKRTENQEAIMALGYSNGSLNVLTYQKNIYTVVDNNKLVFKQKVTSEPNVINTLYKYNFLEQCDWQAFYQWMFILRTYTTIPQGPLQQIIVVRAYGDIYFVGTTHGVLLIFYKPFINGEMDLFNSVPIRQVNFMERFDIPVLANCPILEIDVCETEYGHNVFVAMPKKVAVLKYTHSFMRPASFAYENVYEMNKAQYLDTS